MNKKAVYDRIVEIGIVPVIRASTPAEARLAARAVSQGGIPIVEITMTCPGALEVIAELAKSSGSELLVGLAPFSTPKPPADVLMPALNSWSAPAWICQRSLRP